MELSQPPIEVSLNTRDVSNMKWKQRTEWNSILTEKAWTQRTGL